jgi:hypothetical protein
MPCMGEDILVPEEVSMGVGLEAFKAILSAWAGICTSSQLAGVPSPRTSVGVGGLPPTRGGWVAVVVAGVSNDAGHGSRLEAVVVVWEGVCGCGTVAGVVVIVWCDCKGGRRATTGGR